MANDRVDGSLKGFAHGDPRNERIAAKRATIVDAARTLFLSDGYGATTLEAVAAEAGVSKMTLYRHFGSKEALFEALVHMLADGMGGLDGSSPTGGSAEERLRAFGLAFSRTLMRPDALAFYRMIIAEAERFPDLAALFQDRGRARAQGWVADLLVRELDLGPREAAMRAAEFDALTLGDLYQRRLLGLATEGDDSAAIERQVERAVAYACR